MPAVIIPAIAGIAGAVISARAKSKSGSRSSSGGDYSSTAFSKKSSQLKPWEPAQGALSQITQGMGQYYDPTEQIIKQHQAELGTFSKEALQQTADSVSTKQAQQYAQARREGSGDIGASDITSYASGLYNNRAIQEQMKGLESSANRRLQGLIQGSRNNYDANGMYNSGMAQTAESDIRRGTAESLNNAELAMRGQQYNHNLSLASSSLAGNVKGRDFGNIQSAGFGQQSLGNIQDAATAQQRRLDQSSLMSYQDKVRQQSQGRTMTEQLSRLVNPMAQAYGLETKSGDDRTKGVSPRSSSGTFGGGSQSGLGAGLSSIGRLSPQQSHALFETSDQAVKTNKKKRR
jgi:hypothetical protein